MPDKKIALICGISGQDGAYLASLLLGKGYEVYGTSRDAEKCAFVNLKLLNILENVTVLSMSTIDYASVLQILKSVKPDEIYNLAGQSSVGLSFELPHETIESITIGTLNLLEAMRSLDGDIRLYNACSSECFGDVGTSIATEKTPFYPRSPYAVAKATSFWEVVNYREAYNLFACNGILFNHESPLRPARFVTRKIVETACKISLGRAHELVLGNIEISRDWGWAAEYVEAMWMMLNRDMPSDYVIATGQTHKLSEFISCVFSQLDLDWKDFTKSDSSKNRPSDILVSKGDPSKAKKELGWEAKILMEDVATRMVKSELARLKQS